MPKKFKTYGLLTDTSTGMIADFLKGFTVKTNPAIADLRVSDKRNIRHSPEYYLDNMFNELEQASSQVDEKYMGDDDKEKSKVVQLNMARNYAQSLQEAFNTFCTNHKKDVEDYTDTYHDMLRMKEAADQVYSFVTMMLKYAKLADSTKDANADLKETEIDYIEQQEKLTEQVNNVNAIAHGTDMQNLNFTPYFQKYEKMKMDGEFGPETRAGLVDDTLYRNGIPDARDQVLGDTSSKAGQMVPLIMAGQKLRDENEKKHAKYTDDMGKTLGEHEGLLKGLDASYKDAIKKQEESVKQEIAGLQQAKKDLETQLKKLGDKKVVSANWEVAQLKSECSSRSFMLDQDPELALGFKDENEWQNTDDPKELKKAANKAKETLKKLKESETNLKLAMKTEESDNEKKKMRLPIVNVGLDKLEFLGKVDYLSNLGKVESYPPEVQEGILKLKNIQNRPSLDEAYKFSTETKDLVQQFNKALSDFRTYSDFNKMLLGIPEGREKYPNYKAIEKFHDSLQHLPKEYYQACENLARKNYYLPQDIEQMKDDLRTFAHGRGIFDKYYGEMVQYMTESDLEKIQPVLQLHSQLYSHIYDNVFMPDGKHVLSQVEQDKSDFDTDKQILVKDAKPVWEKLEAEKNNLVQELNAKQEYEKNTIKQEYMDKALSLISKRSAIIEKNLEVERLTTDLNKINQKINQRDRALIEKLAEQEKQHDVDKRNAAIDVSNDKMLMQQESFRHILIYKQLEQDLNVMNLYNKAVEGMVETKNKLSQCGKEIADAEKATSVTREKEIDSIKKRKADLVENMVEQELKLLDQLENANKTFWSDHDTYKKIKGELPDCRKALEELKRDPKKHNEEDLKNANLKLEGLLDQYIKEKTKKEGLRHVPYTSWGKKRLDAAVALKNLFTGSYGMMNRLDKQLSNVPDAASTTVEPKTYYEAKVLQEGKQDIFSTVTDAKISDLKAQDMADRIKEQEAREGKVLEDLRTRQKAFIKEHGINPIPENQREEKQRLAADAKLFEAALKDKLNQILGTNPDKSQITMNQPIELKKDNKVNEDVLKRLAIGVLYKTVLDNPINHQNSIAGRESRLFYLNRDVVATKIKEIFQDKDLTAIINDVLHKKKDKSISLNDLYKGYRERKQLAEKKANAPAPQKEGPVKTL